MENTLRIERAIKRMTQAELADKVEVSRQAINAIETGKFMPSALLAIKLAKVFEKTVEDIFTIQEDAANPVVQEANNPQLKTY